MMLSYMEQKPLFDAINFDFEGMWDFGNVVNATIINMRVNSFLCPSDPNAGSYNTNSYLACMGATTNQWNDSSTGLFTRHIPYGLRDCIDGSSQTIAFSEGLVGNPEASNTHRENAVTGVSPPAGYQQFNVFSAAPGVILSAIQSCDVAFKTAGGGTTNITGICELSLKSCAHVVNKSVTTSRSLLGFSLRRILVTP